MLLGLDLKTWLGLGILGAMVSTVGALLGIVIKDYFFARSLERWKQQQTLEQVYQKFRDPLYLAARELASRSLEIFKDYPTVYLKAKVFESRPTRQIENSIDDAYFQRYKLISTIYRLSAFLGWLELYRQEITFLPPAQNKHAKALEVAADLIRSDLADGQINDADDWQEWRDTLIFREELRAIGESLIENRGSVRAVMGYGHYCEQMESDSDNAVKRWLPVVMNFYLDLETHGKDFRRVRLQRMFVHLVDFMRLLDRSSITPYLNEACATLRSKIP
ncbi:MAG: hypothetical protein ABL891_01530 [Burkholderiales bacterium]